jgi:DHA1 family multidrug resistance protein-like MFS transporter
MRLSPTVLASELTEQERRRGIGAIMISTFFAWGGFFLVIPLMAAHYVDNIGWAASSLGLVLAIRQLTQQGLATFFGPLCDRIGPKPLIVTGMLIRAAGFSAMAFSASFWPVVAATILAAFGGSMFDAPKEAALAALSRPATRQRLFATIGVISGMGTTVGTQIGAMLIKSDFRFVCLAGGCAYVVIFFVMLALMPNLGVSTSEGTPGGLMLPLRDRNFMLFLICLSGYWFVSSQLGLSISLAAIHVTGTDSAISWLYGVNAGIVVGLGYLLPRWLERWLTSLQMLIVGLGILSVGILMVGFAHGIGGLLLAAAVFSLGAVLSRPGQETVTANLASPTARGAYFGIALLSLAVGGGMGNYLGGVLYDLGERPGLALLPWTVFAAAGLLSSAGLFVNRRRFNVSYLTEDLHDLPSVAAEPAPELAIATQR